MIDERYNSSHCDGCKKGCGDCQDAYKTESGIKPVKVGNNLNRWDYDPDGYCLMRYAQRKCLSWLVQLAETQGVAV